MRKIARKFLRLTIFACFFSLVLVVVSNAWVKHTAKGKLYDEVAATPVNDVGLLLGTSRYVSGSTVMNSYYWHRMQAAAALYHAGKVKHLILSGGNHTRFYNEPKWMRNSLLELGVPDSVMTLDYAGFRTLDSVVRCKGIFGQSRIVIISQQFHNERAVFLASRNGIEAIGFNAKNAMPFYLRMQVRERLARVKAVMDSYLLRTQPRFMGERIELPI